MNCDIVISQDIDRAACDNQIFTGYEQTGYIMAKADISSYTMSDNCITAITLKTGKKAYHIYTPVKQPFNGSSVSLNSGTVQNGFNKKSSFVILNDGSVVCNAIVDPLANGEWVVIQGRKWANDDAEKYEVIGIEKGAIATAIDNDVNSADTNGGWSIELTEEAATKSKIFFHTADDHTALEALCNAAQ